MKLFTFKYNYDIPDWQRTYVEGFRWSVSISKDCIGATIQALDPKTKSWIDGKDWYFLSFTKNWLGFGRTYNYYDGPIYNLDLGFMSFCWRDWKGYAKNSKKYSY